MTNDLPRPRIRLTIVGRLILGIGLLAWLVSRLDMAAVRSALRQTNWVLLLAGTALVWAAQIAAALSWYFGLRVVLHPSRRQYLSPGAAVAFFWGSLLLAVTSPGAIGGDASRVFYLRHRGVRLKAAIAAGVNQRINSLAAAVTVAGVLAWLFTDFSAVSWLRPAALGVAVFACVAAPVFVLIGAHAYFPAQEGGRLKLELLAFAAAVLAHTASALGVAVAARPLLPALSFPELTAVAALAKVVGLLGIVPAGLGVLEAATVYLTSLAGGSLDQGGALAIIQRILAILMYVVIGATVLVGRDADGGAEGRGAAQ